MYLFNITEYIHIHFTYLSPCNCSLYVTWNTIDETTIVTQYFAIISEVVKWHAVLFEGALLIKITTISILFI